MAGGREHHARFLSLFFFVAWCRSRFRVQLQRALWAFLSVLILFLHLGGVDLDLSFVDRERETCFPAGGGVRGEGLRIPAERVSRQAATRVVRSGETKRRLKGD